MSREVTVGAGFTKNLGNFESARIDIKVAERLEVQLDGNKLTVYEEEGGVIAPGESYEDAIDKLYAIVEAAVVEKVQAIDAELEGR
jgi:hypothetical protein